MREQGEPDSLHTPVQGVGSIPSHHRSVKAAIDLYNAGGDRGRPRLEFHIADHRWTGFYLRTDFPVPPRGRIAIPRGRATRWGLCGAFDDARLIPDNHTIRHRCRDFN